ncbi:HAD family hydrolase [Bacillus sp. V5-8f]|uniref:HAD family hydrolase n=1 Tax=Bacillus sp. V5-8f TaxID=2053044 RepID=UPI000C76F971|nr:HAD family hydrolase [Bacillus sp. V5-8f]PLT33769.1 haloacid dehalogenase [Bacillus sp. V5-8f]
MVYRMLAVNIDGTLLQSNGRMNKLTKDAIEYVHRKDVQVALVTSRNFYSAKKVAKALKINPTLVAHQGAFVGTNIQKPLYVSRMPEKLTLEIVQLLEKVECQIQVSHEKFILGNRVNLPENLLGRAVMFMNEQNIFSQHYVDSVSEELAKKPVAPPKIDVLFNSDRDKEDLFSLIADMFPEVHPISRMGMSLSIVPKGVSKWTGLLHLANQLKIKPSQIVTIGDSLDDMEMITESGLGVAMGNAPFELKKAAKWVTRSNDENGVAYMLKEFFRKQHPIAFLEKMNILK